MARYEVRSLDVWGNAVEDYSINQSYVQGTLLVKAEATEEDIVKALVASGFLDKPALEAFQEDELHVNDEFEIVDISVNDQEWAAVSRGGDARWLDVHTQEQAEESLEEGERAELVVGQRPLLQLNRLEGDEDAVPFLRQYITRGRSAQHPNNPLLEIRVNPDKLVTGDKTKIDTYVDGDYFDTIFFGNLDDGELGVAASGVVVEGDGRLLGTAKVALDAFLENGGEIDPRFDVEPKKPKKKYFVERGGTRKFIAQQHGPQSGYAYTINLEGSPLNWNEAPEEEWETRVVDREQFGEEVGVVVIDGVEMYVWGANWRANW